VAFMSAVAMAVVATVVAGTADIAKPLPLRQHYNRRRSAADSFGRGCPATGIKIR
jgi:hypothetical protein